VPDFTVDGENCGFCRGRGTSETGEVFDDGVYGTFGFGLRG